ncbi:MAG: ribbon-helix-helix protein, CopG family [Candidatus Wildermuthbacteria bacterium]|nr:ribbon-helix-helix protein, CopG family [Candidatus Wildermuthbacteria bacterium]
MRSVINISLPPELNKTVERLAKKGNYATKSEFLRELIRARVAEEDLVSRVEESRREIRAGKGRVLRSLRDLR